MSSTIYGLVANTLTPSKDFRVEKDATGKFTGSMTFLLRRGDYSDVAVLLNKGELLSAIYTQLDPYFTSILTIDTHSLEENQGGSGGGIDNVIVNFIGFEPADEEQSEREKIYDWNGSLTESPIIQHPKFLLLDELFRKPIVACFEGKFRSTGDGITEDVQFYDVYSGLPQGVLTDETALLWFRMIVIRGVKTYQNPAGEYTETQTDLGGLTDAEIADLGKITVPPNSPATPPDRVWILSGATETKSSTNPITWSRTWSTIEDNDDNQLIYGV